MAAGAQQAALSQWFERRPLRVHRSRLQRRAHCSTARGGGGRDVAARSGQSAVVGLQAAVEEAQFNRKRRCTAGRSRNTHQVSVRRQLGRSRGTPKSAGAALRRRRGGERSAAVLGSPRQRRRP